MPLYDLFEHTQYIPVYLPPAPEGNVWSVVKTFGPSIIAGSIAIMAYRLSREQKGIAETQKEIAANKYNLDLFDKRYDIFESLSDVNDIICTIHIPDYSNESFFDYDGGHKSKEELVSEQIDLISSIIRLSALKEKKVIKSLKKALKIYNSIDEEKLEFLCKEIDMIVKYLNEICDKYKCDKNTIMNDLQYNLNYELRHLTMGGNKIDEILVEAVVSAKNIKEYFLIIYNEMNIDLCIAKNAYIENK
ncbi:hypothetical protein [Novacetimonas hansenii]|uniref:hypothetical protein n=1 Tax=Novacetimonas hansenii TaxID=436 RepID=UPI000A3F446F|nr:hypothetical protein [Novacetimonas hansenii]